MVCSCSRTIREVFFCFPTPFHASLSFSFHSPHIILLLQAAFPDELTLNLPWSVALVDLCSGECHQVTLIVRCQGERCKLPKGRATWPNISGQCQAECARLQCQAGMFLRGLLPGFNKQKNETSPQEAIRKVSFCHILQVSPSEWPFSATWEDTPSTGPSHIHLVLNWKYCFPSGHYLILQSWRKLGSFEKLDSS